MGIRGAILCCLVMSLLFAATSCHGEDETVEVVGVGECEDCAQGNIKASQAFSGLGVSIDCKETNGNLKTRGVGELNEGGKFKVTLPNEIIEEDGKLKEECFAQLHSTASSTTVPCHAHNHTGLDSLKIVFNSKTINGKHTFGLRGTLKFSRSLTCSTSAFLLPKLPPLTNLQPLTDHSPLRKLLESPIPIFKPLTSFPNIPPISRKLFIPKPLFKAIPKIAKGLKKPKIKNWPSPPPPVAPNP